MRPFDQAGGFGVVEAFQRHGVDLDLQPGLVGGVEAGEHAIEFAPARHLAEFVGIERIERNVDALDAAGGEIAGEAGKLRAVGGQRQLIERAALEVTRQRTEKRHHIAPHQRLAAGKPQLARSQPDERRAQAIEFLERQDVPFGQEVHVLGHAVDAAEIAAVGHGDAHVGDRATEGIDERSRRHGSVRGHAL